jgi:ribosome-associated toxin RatA of RatAB toxin-antitoxin module
MADVSSVEKMPKFMPHFVIYRVVSQDQRFLHCAETTRVSRRNKFITNLQHNASSAKIPLQLFQLLGRVDLASKSATSDKIKAT